MKILLVHNHYKYSGGEDVVFSAEKKLLESYNHYVTTYEDTNNHVKGLEKIHGAANAIWSYSSANKIQSILEVEKPDVVHFHNIFFNLSPSVFWACKKSDIPVVQTLHNYRMICPAATLFRKKRICEKCQGTFFPWPAVQYGCYRNSRIETALVGFINTFHKIIGTWQDKIDIFITLTEFSRRKLIEGGIRSEKIYVKPNFMPSNPQRKANIGDFALFIGFLDKHKGIFTLLNAFRKLKNIPLKIVGDGPQKQRIRTIVQKENLNNIQIIGRIDRSNVLKYMQKARLLIFPSECYEGFPVTIVEAMASGLPLIVSGIGAMAEIIQHGKNGLHFLSGNPSSLADAVNEVWNDDKLTTKLSEKSREKFERLYTPKRNYEILMNIYNRAIETAKS